MPDARARHLPLPVVSRTGRRTVERSSGAFVEDDGMELFRKIWRHRLSILLLAAAGGLAGSLAALSMTPRYESETRLLIGIEQPQITDIPQLLKDMPANQELMQSQGFIITSRVIAERVVRRLALDRDPEFNTALRPRPLWRQWLNDGKAWLRDRVHALTPMRDGDDDAIARSPETPEQRRRRLDEIVTSQLMSRIDARPLHRSHVLAVTAWSETPETAARIANALADAYVEQQFVRREEVSDTASDWLNRRIAELRREVEDAERSTEEYRREHGLFETRNDKVTEQRLAELNTQLTIAETERAAAQVRLTQVREVERSNQSFDSLPAVMHSPLIQALLQRRVEAERQAAELSATLGPRHPRILDMRAQLDDIRQRINEEVKKVLKALNHELDAANARVAALRTTQAELQGRLAQDNEKAIHLRELERQAEANRRLLVNFLERQRETATLPGAGSQSSTVISEAAVPLAPSYPPTTMLRLLGAIGGALLGMTIALFRENLDRTFRTGRQVENATRLPLLAVLPPADRCRDEQQWDSAFNRSIGNLIERLRRPPGTGMRKVIMLVSATPREGKSSIAIGLARQVTRTGGRAIVLDCDWRRPAINRHYDRPAEPGLGDLLSGTATPDDVVFRDPESGAHAIFAGQFAPQFGDADRHARLRSLLDTLSRHYDLVIVDAPPVMAGPDALALARVAGAVALVARWGGVSRDIVAQAARSLSCTGTAMEGVILSEASPRRCRRYGLEPIVATYPDRHVARAAWA